MCPFMLTCLRVNITIIITILKLLKVKICSFWSLYIIIPHTGLLRQYNNKNNWYGVQGAEQIVEAMAWHVGITFCFMVKNKRYPGQVGNHYIQQVTQKRRVHKCMDLFVYTLFRWITFSYIWYYYKKKKKSIWKLFWLSLLNFDIR